MGYCTLSDLRSALGDTTVLELVDDERSGSMGAAQTARVNYAIAQADAEIESYLSQRYAIPVSPVPAVLNAIAVDITTFYLFRRRMVAFGIPEAVRDQYDTRLKQLADIASGDSSLPAAPGGSEPTETEGTTLVQSEGPAQLFTGYPDGGTLGEF